MAEDIKFRIELSPEAQLILARMGDAPALLQAVAGAMDRTNEVTVGRIQEQRLTGKGPFAPEQHRLGERSHQLRKSLRRSNATVSGSEVESAIGSPLVYAGVHEFGAVIRRKARSGVARLRTDRSGNLMRQRGHPRLAVFGRSTHKQVREVAYEAKAYEIRIPARAPITTGVGDRLEALGNAISEAVVRSMEGQ